MKKTLYLLSLCLCISTNLAFSNSTTGKITTINFASTIADTSRPGSAQFSIEGGFTTPGYNSTYAAIAKEDTHLISLLLMAKAHDKTINVFLDATSKYLHDRCLYVV